MTESHFSDGYRAGIEAAAKIADDHYEDGEGPCSAGYAIRQSIQEVQPGSQPTISPEASRGADPEGTQAPDCGQDVSSKDPDDKKANP